MGLNEDENFIEIYFLINLWEKQNQKHLFIYVGKE